MDSLLYCRIKLCVDYIHEYGDRENCLDAHAHNNILTARISASRKMSSRAQI